MKKSLRLVLAAVLCLAGFATANAQFHFGPKLGVCVNNLKFDKEVLSSDNRAGFTGGVMAEFTVPVIGVGADASLMYVRRSSLNVLGLDKLTGTTSATEIPLDKVNTDYLCLPINLKWKITTPVAKIVTPYIVTGPEFAFLCSKKDINAALEGKSVDVAWNFGLGVQLLGHLQLQASYGLGITKAVTTLTPIEGANIDGKNKYWTITAAYLF